MLYEKYQEAVDQFIAQNRQQIIASIKRLVDIPSVEGPAEPGKPFGAGPAAALAEGLKLAEELGLSTHNSENMIGWAELQGETDKQIATITHLDVVPEGTGWNSNPFEMIEKDGWIIGRGVTDDKGPSVLCLYALKFLKDYQVPLKYNVRALLGVNEETSMGDVDYYLENYPAPDFCFSPDAEFPLTCGEKGGFRAVLVSKELSGNIVDFTGGVANNAVPNRATCLVKGDISKLASRDGITVEEDNGLIRIEAYGKGGHASMPEGTVNAIGLIVDYLLDYNLCSDSEREYLEYLQKLHHATDGSGVGIAAEDDVFTPLTIIGGVIHMENGRLYQNVDSRYPTSTNAEKIAQGLQNAACGCASVESVHDSVPFYCDPNRPSVQALINTYNDVTGKNGKPFTIGGGTYARHFPVAVSFGPEDHSITLPDFAGPIHGANEGAQIDQLMESLKIYILSLIRLQEVEI